MIGVGASIAFASNVVTLQGPQPIGALVTPASAPLEVGQTLADTPNWALFTRAANYIAGAPEATIATVRVDYIGDVPDDSTALAEGDRIGFAIIVTDSAGNSRTFGVQPRVVASPAPVFTGPLSPISYQQGLGPQVYEDAQAAFSGSNIAWSVSGAENLTIRPDGFIEVNTDLIDVQSGTVLTITAANSGGAVSGTTTLQIDQTVVSITNLTEGAADVDTYPGIGAQLSNGREIDSFRWGSTPGGAQYGTAQNPQAFTAGTLHVEVDAGVNTYATSVPAIDLLKFDVQPSFGAPGYTVGDTLTLIEGTASPAATITVEDFRLDGVDKSGALSGLSWDTTGETAGIITARFRASSAGQADILSDEITVGLNAVAASVSPRINTLTIGALSGTNLPVSISMTEDQPTPYSVYIVGIPAGAVAPSATQIKAGHDADAAPAVFAGSYTVSTAGVINVNLGGSPGGTFDFYATVEDSEGDLWDNAAFVMDVDLNTSAFSVERIGTLQGSRSDTDTVSYNVDLSGCAAGDELLFMLGTRAYGTALTVEGEVATKISVDQDAAGASLTTAFKYVMTGDGSAAATVVVTLAAVVRDHLLMVYGVKDGTIGTGAAVAHAYRSSGTDPITLAVTPTGGPNYVIAFSVGPTSYIDDGIVTWTDLNQIYLDAPPLPDNRKMAVAGLLRPGDSAPLTFSFQAGSGGASSLLGIAITAD